MEEVLHIVSKRKLIIIKIKKIFTKEVKVKVEKELLHLDLQSHYNLK